MAVAVDAARADTFPKLLTRNARLYGGRPAYRHKDLGIWQVWTWGQVLVETRAYAAGLSRLGVKRGDTVAIVGSNRPRLYWSVMTAQMLGAIPVPVYADAVADELAYVLAHADVRFAAVEDQEQVDKILTVSERLPKLEQVVYDEPRGLRDYDHSRLKAIDDVIRDGHAALASEASGQRGNSEVRAHRASEDARERADDTRPEPGSSARVDFETYRLRTFVESLGADELERRSGATRLSAVAQALEANPKAVLFDDAGGHPLIGNALASRSRFASAFGVAPQQLL